MYVFEVWVPAGSRRLFDCLAVGSAYASRRRLKERAHPKRHFPTVGPWTEEQHEQTAQLSYQSTDAPEISASLLHNR